MGTEEDIPPVTPGTFIGPDRLFQRGRQLVIDSPSDMPDWQVRTYRRTRIHYEGAAYFIAKKMRLNETLWRHVLEPWPEEPADPPWTEIRYGPAWVAEREEHRRAVMVRRQAMPFLWALWTVSGFLPSRVQARLDDRYQITPTVAVERSLFFQYLLTVVLGALLVIATWTNILDARKLLAVVLVLGVDALIRRDALVNEEPNPPGFYEWLWQAIADGIRRLRKLF